MPLNLDEILSYIRPDGTPKGEGFLGSIKRPDGPKVMSEYSVGSPDVTGKEMDYPSMVPTLNRQELMSILNSQDGVALPDSVYQKAADFARSRVAAGKSVFAGPGEAQYHIFPDIKRTHVPTSGFNDAVIKPMPSHGLERELLLRQLKTR